MRYLKLFEAFDGSLSSTPPANLEEQITFSMKWYPTLYDSKYGRMKVLDHMYLGYGTEYEWENGELVNVLGDNNDYDMYEHRYRVWEGGKKELEKRLERLLDHYEEMSGIIGRDGSKKELHYLKEIQDEINELQDEMDNFNPYRKEYPDEKPLNVEKLNYSKNYSPIFNIPEDVTPDYLEGAREIVKYIMDNTTSTQIRIDFEPIAKKLLPDEKYKTI